MDKEYQIIDWLQESDEEEQGSLEDLLSSEDEEDHCIEEPQSEEENDEEDQVTLNSAALLTNRLSTSSVSDEDDAPLSDLQTYKTFRGRCSFINIAGINGMIIDCMVNHNYQRISRRDYLRSVAVELTRPQMRQRLFFKNIPRGIRERSMLFLGINESELTPQENDIPRKRTKTARCHDCGRAKDRSTRTACHKCNKPVCNDHKYSVCIQCYNQSVNDLDRSRIDD